MTTDTGFTLLEQNILKSKGLSDEQLAKLVECGVNGKSDFATIGDSQTLADVVGLDITVAESLMNWALGMPNSSDVAEVPFSPTDSLSAVNNLVIDSADIVNCAYCSAKQPKDYKSGDLCFSCGKQAEPTATCYWCASSGPGKFCRQCGSKFVNIGELEIAVLLRRDGVSKDEIYTKLEKMDDAEKQVLWERARR